MNIEDFIKHAYKRIKEQRKDTPVGNCLSEEDMAYFIDNALGQTEMESFLVHLMSCSKCAGDMKEYYATMKAVDAKGLVEVPEFMMQKARDVVAEEAKKTVLDIVLEFKEKVMGVIRTTGEILQEPQLSLAHAYRIPKKERALKEIRVSKDFDNLTVDVEVERQKPELANIIVRLTDKISKKRATGVRISLVKNDRELESSLIEGGKVKFEEIKLNDYRINLIRDDKQIGTINISIKASK